MPRSCGPISSAKGRGTKFSPAKVSPITAFTSSVSATGTISPGCDGAVPCASSGLLDCDETSFLGDGEDCHLERPVVVHKKASASTAAAPTAAHSNIRREAA